jgi:hypothetical protein
LDWNGTIQRSPEELRLQVLNKAELGDWFAKLANKDSQSIQYDMDGPFFEGDEASCIQIQYPQKLERLPFLARTLATINYESKDFAGALIWFTEWGVWNYSDEGVGYRIVEAIHRGEPTTFVRGRTRP